MYKLLLPAVAIAAFTFCGAAANEAHAKGVHLRVGGLHVDVGHPHGHGRGYQSYYPPQRYGNPWGYPGGGGGWGYGGPAHRWHDTSHYDYHQPEVYRHRNHYHVQPGHWDYHQDGHWDHHHP